MSELPTKLCARCGRTITWRRKWSRDWESVRWCSEACRRAGVGAPERRVEEAILEAIEARAASASICPSEVARSLWPEDWRPRLEEVREAARRLVAEGRVEITQGGRAVDPSTAKGPIRIRRVRR